MSSFWQNHIKLSVFGESHGPAIGATLDGLPAGVPIDETLIEEEMKRRAASGKALATPRKEADRVEIVSGLFNGRTTGTPLTGIIRNGNTRSGDYARTKDLMRPGHADYTAKLRYGGYSDYRGGGHFSGRLTAPLVFAGSVCKQVLAAECPGLVISSRIVSIGRVFDDTTLTPENYETFHAADPMFPLADETKKEAMLAEIKEAASEEDSVGGVIEGFATGVPGGLGSPMFDGVESVLASLLYAIPAVKGVSFGAGFDFATMRGSLANDAFVTDGKTVRTRTNHNGGINGGITNAMPIVFRAAFKPTPSIAKTQRTVNLAEMTETDIHIKGRHDPCIVLRAAPVVEAAAAIGLLDLLIEAEGVQG